MKQLNIKILQQYNNKAIQKITNFDDVTGETQRNTTQIGDKYLIIHTEY